METEKNVKIPKWGKLLLVAGIVGIILVTALLVRKAVSRKNNYSAEEVLDYFSEVVLSSEYGTGDASSQTLVRKWVTPVRYYLYGGYTDEDETWIEGFFDEMGELLPAFPGAERVSEREDATLTIGFYPESEFGREMAAYMDEKSADGCMTFWFDPETCEITSAVIGYNGSMPQDIRKSVILEELYQSLGIPDDTSVREDSVIYKYGSEISEFSDMDLCILKLLYLPEMKCGMGREECAEVIRKNYRK